MKKTRYQEPDSEGMNYLENYHKNCHENYHKNYLEHTKKSANNQY